MECQQGEFWMDYEAAVQSWTKLLGQIYICGAFSHTPSKQSHVNSSTVPLKCKLTVSTRNTILDPRSFRESRIEFRGSSFDFRGSRTKFRGSSFEFRDTRRIFEDLEQRFRGNDLILENKTIAKNKAIDARLYSRKLTRCWMYANIFSCNMHFLHMRFAYLHWSWWQQTSLASKCVYNVSNETSNFFLRDYNPERVCCFHFRDFNWALKT